MSSFTRSCAGTAAAYIADLSARAKPQGTTAARAGAVAVRAGAAAARAGAAAAAAAPRRSARALAVPIRRRAAGRRLWRRRRCVVARGDWQA